MILSEIIDNCNKYLKSKGFKSYDPFDALTCSWINTLTKRSPLLRRVAIQINSKSPIDIHWIGMKRMVHTKTISDLLWYHSVRQEKSMDEINHYFQSLLELRNPNGFGWGLNFPYTSRFIDADANMPNLYNTINSAIAICYSYYSLSDENKYLASRAIEGVLEFIEDDLGFVNEGERGWYLYYPGQSYPTYNVNALALYFLTFAHKLKIGNQDIVLSRIRLIGSLLCNEQQADGSWLYSRSPKGAWVDGFHSGFVVESLAFALKEGVEISGLKSSVEKGWRFFTDNMFTSDGFPKYFSYSNMYPIEAQNCAQAIQTISNIGLWLHWDQRELLEKVIRISVDHLYDPEGYFYHKKTRYLVYKTPYVRWSITPMILAFEYARQYLGKDRL